MIIYSIINVFIIIQGTILSSLKYTLNNLNFKCKSLLKTRCIAISLVQCLQCLLKIYSNIKLLYDGIDH